MKKNKRDALEVAIRKHISVKQKTGEYALKVVKSLQQLKKSKIADLYYLEDFSLFMDANFERKAFIQAVFYLANPYVNILNQRMHATTGNGNEMSDVNMYEVAEMIRTGIYVNPITKESLNEIEFADQVKIYFVPSEFFWSVYHG